MPAPSILDQNALLGLLRGVQNIVAAPMAFERSDPDKNRVREIQALIAFILQSEMSADNSDRQLQLVGQLKLLFEEIGGVGTRVTMKPAVRLVERAMTLLQGAGSVEA